MAMYCLSLADARIWFSFCWDNRIIICDGWILQTNYHHLKITFKGWFYYKKIFFHNRLSFSPHLSSSSVATGSSSSYSSSVSSSNSSSVQWLAASLWRLRRSQLWNMRWQLLHLNSEVTQILVIKNYKKNFAPKP